jgi:GDPmannose 4,6-dehydratase
LITIHTAYNLQEKVNKKVIITGVTGQVGSYMAEFILENTAFDVVGAMRRTSQAITSNLSKVIDSPRFKFAPLDLVDVHSITDLIKKEKPDYFLNFGASTFVADSWNNPALCMQVNSVALIHILEAIRNYSPECRVYSSGSSEQYSGVEVELENYAHPFNPCSIYGVSKCAADLISKVYKDSYSLYVVHGILFNNESPRRQKYFVSRKVTDGVARIVKAIKRGEKFKPISLGNLNAKRDWSDSRDFCDGVWRMMNQDAFNPELKGLTGKDLAKKIKNYTLSSGETHEIREFVEKAFKFAKIRGQWIGSGQEEEYVVSDDNQEIINFESDILVDINPEFYRPVDVQFLLGNSDLARKELGWNPKITFDMLVEDMVKSDLNEIDRLK